MRAKDPVRIARIGLVLDLADGSKVMVYADDLPDAQVTITTDEEPYGWDRPAWLLRFPRARRTSILIEGIGAYLVKHADPGAKVSSPGRALETIRREVRS